MHHAVVPWVDGRVLGFLGLGFWGFGVWGFGGLVGVWGFGGLGVWGFGGLGVEGLGPSEDFSGALFRDSGVRCSFGCTACGPQICRLN